MAADASRLARRAGQREQLEGDAVAFVVRYLVAGVLGASRARPRISSSCTTRRFLAAHDRGTDAPALADDATFAGAAPALDAERMRLDLARVTAQAAATQQNAGGPSRRCSTPHRAGAEAVVRGESARLKGRSLLMLIEGPFAAGLAGRVVRRLARCSWCSRWSGDVPLALAVGAGLAACDVLALATPRPGTRDRGRRRPGPGDAVSIVIPT
jgi:hypothetical protein